MAEQLTPAEVEAKVLKQWEEYKAGWRPTPFEDDGTHKIPAKLRKLTVKADPAPVAW